MYCNVLIYIVWAAQAGAKRVYAIEYTDMAKHAKRVVQANGVDHIVTVIQGAVEDVVLPEEDWENIGGSGVGLTREEGDVEDMIDDGKGGKKKNQRVVDIILSEWMGYFLLRGTSVWICRCFIFVIYLFSPTQNISLVYISIQQKQNHPKKKTIVKY